MLHDASQSCVRKAAAEARCSGVREPDKSAGQQHRGCTSGAVNRLRLLAGEAQSPELIVQGTGF
jgi:hypothetical protein